MPPFIIRNNDRAPLRVMIQPGQIDISLAPGSSVQIEMSELTDGENIEIAPHPMEGLTLTIPTTQFKIKQTQTAA
ncbi:MAG: hypothetical protein PVI23_09925 [Maricaulaceae bacterium]|jgi:hypothetical protein